MNFWLTDTSKFLDFQDKARDLPKNILEAGTDTLSNNFQTTRVLRWNNNSICFGESGLCFILFWEANGTETGNKSQTPISQRFKFDVLLKLSWCLVLDMIWILYGSTYNTCSRWQITKSEEIKKPKTKHIVQIIVFWLSFMCLLHSKPIQRTRLSGPELAFHKIVLRLLLFDYPSLYFSLLLAQSSLTIAGYNSHKPRSAVK